jgi:hypothetical protein
MVRPVFVEAAYIRNVADWMTQPCGLCGRSNFTRARMLLLDLDITLRIESVPLLLVGLPLSTHASAVDVTVIAGPQFTGACTVQLWLAGVPSVLPAASIARTLKLCAPTAKLLWVNPGVHAAKGPPSREHSKVEPDSLAENVNVALVLVVEAAGPESIVVSGGVESEGDATVQLYAAAVESELPAGSVARTSNV